MSSGSSLFDADGIAASAWSSSPRSCACARVRGGMTRSAFGDAAASGVPARRDQRDGGVDFHDVARLHAPFQQRAVERRLEFDRRLVGFDDVEAVAAAQRRAGSAQELDDARLAQALSQLWNANFARAAQWTPTLAASLTNSAAALPPEGELFAPRGGPAALTASLPPAPRARARYRAIPRIRARG